MEMYFAIQVKKGFEFVIANNIKKACIRYSEKRIVNVLVPTLEKNNFDEINKNKVHKKIDVLLQSYIFVVIEKYEDGLTMNPEVYGFIRQCSSHIQRILNTAIEKVEIASFLSKDHSIIQLSCEELELEEVSSITENSMPTKAEAAEVEPAPSLTIKQRIENLLLSIKENSFNSFISLRRNRVLFSLPTRAFLEIAQKEGFVLSDILRRPANILNHVLSYYEHLIDNKVSLTYAALVR